MISIPHLRENYDEILIAFKKRDFDAKNVIDNLLNEDKNRREIQVKLDNKLFESNQLTKEIGKLYKDGKTNEANKKKSLSLKIKNESKNLVEKLSNCEQSIKELQYKIPNIPNIRVPNGKSSTREELKQLIEKNGGYVKSSISNKIQYLLCGENAGPSKILKAKSLKIKIIDEKFLIDKLTMKS